jgi:predicted nuclease of restriction endonuclease-like (RecB) superfamily
MDLSKGYKDWIIELKFKIRSTQLKAAVAVNIALTHFYWELGKSINEKQTAWGSKFLEKVSKDLQDEFPNMKGFSVSNLKTCRLFYQYFSFGSQTANLKPNNNLEKLIRSQVANELKNQVEISQTEYEISNHPVFRIPWGHIKIIITKIKHLPEANFYINQTIENSWSRDILDLQIKSNLYDRKGKAITNFKNTLPEPLSDLAVQTLKDPYIFDFLSLDINYRERDIEKQLIQHISKFLLELGKGFAFVGNQYHIQVADNDYYLDLLFYHIKLKCYVVIELKNTKFIPEYAGKLNFYLSVVDSLVKEKSDNPTIGILLCKDKNNIEAEFALRDINKPMGISELKLVENLPDHLKSSLPSIEELEQELKKLDENI